VCNGVQTLFAALKFTKARQIKKHCSYSLQINLQRLYIEPNKLYQIILSLLRRRLPNDEIRKTHQKSFSKRD